MRYHTQPFILTILCFLFRVGLCSHGITNMQVTWRSHRRRILSRSVDHVDPSPRDRNQSTCVKANLSEINLPLTWQHVDASGASDLHQTGGASK